MTLRHVTSCLIRTKPYLKHCNDWIYLAIASSLPRRSPNTSRCSVCEPCAIRDRTRFAEQLRLQMLNHWNNLNLADNGPFCELGETERIVLRCIVFLRGEPYIEVVADDTALKATQH